MARQLHIFIHTRDAAGWNESAHRRAANGQFGEGSGSGGSVSSVAGGAVKLKGDELGDYADMKELRLKAMAHAARFIGKSFKNKSTGNEIVVPKSGVKHTIQGSGDVLIRTIPSIPQLLENGVRDKDLQHDKHGNPNVASVEIYRTPISIDGKTYTAICTVKVDQDDGRRYYDHGIITPNADGMKRDGAVK